jgi:hypothetical protein
MKAIISDIKVIKEGFGYKATAILNGVEINSTYYDMEVFRIYEECSCKTREELEKAIMSKFISNLKKNTAEIIRHYTRHKPKVYVHIKSEREKFNDWLDSIVAIPYCTDKFYEAAWKAAQKLNAIGKEFRIPAHYTLARQPYSYRIA